MPEQEKSNTTPIALTSKDPKERMKEITDKLEQGIKDIFNSDRYKQYLNTVSKFHNFSFRNTVLILMQNPDATQVAGFSSWRDNFNRTPKKGEHGMKIIAPSMYEVEIEQKKIDPKTKKPVIGADGKPIMEKVKQERMGFRVATVFDVEQTEGEPLPTLANKLTANVDNFKDFVKALKKISPMPIKFDKIEGGTDGLCSYEDKRITIQKGMSEAQTLSTIIHEIAHAKLHNIPEKEGEQRPDQKTREVQAESIAYTVCQYFGIDTSNNSFGYIANWSSNKDTAELKASLDIIRNTAADIIKGVEQNMPKLEREQNTAQEQTADNGQAAEPTQAETPKDNIPSENKNNVNPLTIPLDTPFDVLPNETQQYIKENIDDAIIDTLQKFIAVDMDKYGTVMPNTDEALKLCGYMQINGILKAVSDRETEQPPLSTEDIQISLNRINTMIDRLDSTQNKDVIFETITGRLNLISKKLPAEQSEFKGILEFAAQSPDFDTLKERVNEVMNYNISAHEAPAVVAEPKAPTSKRVPKAPTPNSDALEQRAKTGEQIAITDMIDAINADKELNQAHSNAKQNKKPSILGQLEASKTERSAGIAKPPQKQKNNGLEM